MPHHHSSPQQSTNPLPALDLAAAGSAGTQRQPAYAHGAHPTRPLSVRNPRVRAASAYALPFLPALWLLLRERRNRFVRLHAARALTFFGSLALVQILLFAALVVVGGIVTGLTAAAVLGVLFYSVYIACAACGFVLWLLLMRDALAGRATSYPVLGGSSRWLEDRITRAQRRLFPPRAV